LSTGDVNGDGVSDILIGAMGASLFNRSNNGVVYVVYGRLGLSNTNMNVASLNSSMTYGYYIGGATTNDAAGTSVSRADLNNDGSMDIVIGAPAFSTSSRMKCGAIYAVYGKSGNTSNVNLNNLLASRGMLVIGSTDNAMEGMFVSSIGDIDGDNRAEVYMGSNTVSHILYNSLHVLPVVSSSSSSSSGMSSSGSTTATTSSSGSMSSASTSTTTGTTTGSTSTTSTAGGSTGGTGTDTQSSGSIASNSQVSHNPQQSLVFFILSAIAANLVMLF